MPSSLMLTLPELARPEWGKGSVYFVGTATVIIRYAGFTVLTDPNFLHAGDLGCLVSPHDTYPRDLWRCVKVLGHSPM